MECPGETGVAVKVGCALDIVPARVDVAVLIVEELVFAETIICVVTFILTGSLVVNVDVTRPVLVTFIELGDVDVSGSGTHIQDVSGPHAHSRPDEQQRRWHGTSSQTITLSG